MRHAADRQRAQGSIPPISVLPLPEVLRRQHQEGTTRSEIRRPAEIDTAPARGHAAVLRGVLDVWKARQRDATEMEGRLRERLSDLERRESVVERAFLFDKHIDHSTYERQRNELREAMSRVTIELEDVRSNELDVEGCCGSLRTFSVTPRRCG